MGGIIALTVRYSDGEELRTSCWTNILPKGLFSWKFFVGPKEGEKHVREFMDMTLERRRQEPEIEKIWGHWNKLAPVEYGQIIVDFQKKKVIHSQGYTGLDNDHVVSFDHPSMEKFLELYARKLVGRIYMMGHEVEEIANVGEFVDKVKQVYHWARESGHVSGSVTLVLAGPNPGLKDRPPVDLGMVGYKIKSWIPIEGGAEDRIGDVYKYASRNFKLTKAEEKVWKARLKKEEAYR